VTALEKRDAGLGEGARVTIKRTTKSFAQTKILKGVELEIAPREFIILLGPSGCGKTTLLRIIAGLEQADAGEVWIGGRRVDELEPKNRGIAMVFQNYALYPHMNAFDNHAFSLKLRRLPKPEIAARVQQAARSLRLESLLNRFPRQLSGGQRQRVSMGRAMVHSPKVFLFDEPLSNLDAQLRVRMRSEIKQLHHLLNTTSIYVTHDQVEAMTMGDRLVVMNEGVVEQIGSPLEIFDRPATVFVAGFVGSPAMNLVRGAISGQDSTTQFVAGDLRVPLPAGDRLPAGRPVMLGIRPHHLKVDGAGTLSVSVKDVQPTGVETILICQRGDAEFVVQSSQRFKASPGDQVSLSMDTDHLHLFGEDGRRLD